MLNNELLEKRVILIFGVINNEMAVKVINRMMQLDSINNDPITLQICSSGGEALAGLAIIDAMNAISSPIYTVGLSECSSMASLILASGKKGFRKANKNCFIMMHEGIIHLDGEFRDTEERYKKICSINDQVLDLYASYTDKSIDQIRDSLKGSLYLNGESAVQYGIIDGLI